MNSRVVLLGQSHALFLKWAAYFDGKSESILLLVRHQLQAKDQVQDRNQNLQCVTSDRTHSNLKSSLSKAQEHCWQCLDNCLSLCFPL